ncbi:unnamed protein product [Bursaphelenchus xylophilus]|uniref:(pine wood nematode) hypothetical protein n=1 Tax=Bursaphelenchus xylophilus TaxID=6326 RepID=A0A1I7RKY1_BURXY|nr:unnamed protein product [Bursaphelenchus xylophilus]CAG9083724.1 unnamed protein product [Bursaphelenchus xylophilus]
MNRRRSLASVSLHLTPEQLRPLLDNYDFFGEWYELQHVNSETSENTPPEAKRPKTLQDKVGPALPESEIFNERIRHRLERCVRATIESITPASQNTQSAAFTWNAEIPRKFLQLPGTWAKPRATGQLVGNLHVDVSFCRANGVIETLEGKRVGVNKAVMSCFSDFLRQAFYGHNLEAEAGHVVLPRYTHRTLLAFLASIMHEAKGSGGFKGDWFRKELDLALDMLDLAIFLQSPRMINSLAKSLVENATPLTYVLIAHRIGDHQKEYYELLWKKILANFYELIHNNTCRLLRKNEFERALKEQSNISKLEELEALKGWCRYNEKNGGDPKDGHTFRQFQHSNLQEEPASSTGTPFFVSSQHRLPYSVLAVLGGWATAGPTAKAEVFDSYEERWIEPLDNVLGLTSPRSYHEIVPMAKQKRLFVVGGFDGDNYYDGSCIYNLEKKGWEDNCHAFMNEKRCYVSACPLDEHHIMAVGGYNNRIRLQSTEILNTTVNLWSNGARMNHIRSDCHVTLHDEKVYVVGGFDGNSCHQTAEFYDSVENRWYNVGRKMRDKRSGVCSISIKGAIMVAGGFTGRNRLTSCEFYDPREGQWHVIASMNSSRSNFGISKLRDQIYVAGGYDGNGTTTRCEKFDIRLNKWYEIPELKVRRSALSMCTLEGDCVHPEFIQERKLA